LRQLWRQSCVALSILIKSYRRSLYVNRLKAKKNRKRRKRPCDDFGREGSSGECKAEIKCKVEKLDRKPGLAVIIVGEPGLASLCK
jgi:hypothetical protein